MGELVSLTLDVFLDLDVFAIIRQDHVGLACRVATNIRAKHHRVGCLPSKVLHLALAAAGQQLRGRLRCTDDIGSQIHNKLIYWAACQGHQAATVPSHRGLDNNSTSTGLARSKDGCTLGLTLKPEEA